jgi:peptidoglycan/xylan/chitin deacetylase (PgdA/CDA1 family)
MLPPSERSTYQIHIPWRLKGPLPEAAPGGGEATCPAPPVAPTAAAGAHAKSAIRSATAKSADRLPSAAVNLVFTSTANTVARAALRWKTHLRTVYLIAPVNMQAIGTARKILFIALGAALLSGGGPALGAAAAPPRLLRAGLSQAGRSLVLSLRSSTPVALAGLDRLPPAATAANDSRFLCLVLRRPGGAGERRLCLGGPSDARRRAGLELLNAAGRIVAQRTIAARLERPQPQKLVLALTPADAGLVPHRYRWRLVAQLGGCASSGSECAQSLPAQGERTFRLRPVRAVGCTGGNPGLVTNGPRDRRIVALTFDDGPSEYTPGFLDVLRRKHVPGTFFEIGQEMAGRESTMRRILREGDEIGNHTMHHTEFPSYGDIAPTTSLIASITHFRPCLFRPPGGAVDSAVIAAAGADGLRTVTWDVDPTDWSTPGTAAIYSRVVGATQPGSIVLMHDGGGDRSETLAALPSIIDTLRARGYRFETVTELLGDRMLYRPYG